MPKAKSSLEPERGVLSALLQDVDPAPALAELTPADFSYAFYRRLYSHLCERIIQEQPLILVAIREEMNLDGEESAQLAALMDPLLVIRKPGELAAYVGLVKNAARERALKLACVSVAESDGEVSAAALTLKLKLDSYFASKLPSADIQLGSCSVGGLYSAREKEVEWLVWPFAAIGLSTILDALPKVGKTVFILHGIYASLYGKPFLNFPTKKMRTVYVSEQSRPSLALQMRQVGFTGSETIEELRIITREDWSRFAYADFLVKLETEILKPGDYNFLAVDTWHTVARLEDEKDASEVNKLGNLTLDIAARNNMGLHLNRHDRKSGGEIGISGRNSIQLSGLVDTILHLVRSPNQENQRKLEAISRVGLPNEQTIELCGTEYVNWGEPTTEAQTNQSRVNAWVTEFPEISGPEIVARFAALMPPVEVKLRSAQRYLAAALERTP